ncbi:FAD binding domain-containing protein [Actinomycetospora sp. NBRC 106378]|uniref:FAD binding domain-containing protein n=1 Tax=Actinomycetospora sp. NBRC 106378 TaxID=3032208 RepID=UPI0024A1DABC|nr:FAD binding domain-containing protein [Actinomycetospora sp. NBRC 106378]GLZ56062.1 carbon-monoxide dehydrogenase medium subunit [Actinomycetospora sp. NBRC 106378]
MKPAPFEYATPTTLDEAVALLGTPGARVIAGGQSLLQDLRWRRTSASLLVDIARIEELRGVHDDGDRVRIGARVRHVDLERGAVGGPLGRLLAATARWIAHPPVRSRGTMVGSLCVAHPSSEWCGLAAGLDATVELVSVRRRREVTVADFLRDSFTPAAGPDELATALLVPVLPEGTRVGVVESRRTHASYAHVAAVAALLPDGGSRLGLAGAAPTGVRAHAAEAALARGDDPGAAAAQLDADPREHPHAPIPYTRHVAGVLVRRALQEAS